MIYDFDKPTCRFGTSCVKYDTMPNKDTIALWVADMDFETAPSVVEALHRRMQHGCFGYAHTPESYYEAVINWFSRRHGMQLQREWFLLSPGIVPAIAAILRGYRIYKQNMGETLDRMGVLIQSPAYNCFYTCVANAECEHIENRLLLGEDGFFHIDWEDFEAKCALPQTHIFLLCNPQNPTGRVWTREELQRMGEICKRHNVLVVADEIHCEFVNPSLGRPYVPFMEASDAPCVNCISPSKAFNIAGLQISNVIVRDEALRAAIDRAINIHEICDMNIFGIEALQGAYCAEGEEWLNQLLGYLYGNYEAMSKAIKEHLPEWRVLPLEGTYLMWVDISATGLTSEQLSEKLLREANVFVNPGTMYDQWATLDSANNGSHFIRINLATQRANLLEAVRRIASRNEE